MTVSTVLRKSDRLLVGLWLVLAAILLWGGFSEWRTWSRINAGLVPFIMLATFCVVTAISLAKSRASGRWFGGIGGSLLILYSFAIVTMGSEDVGGPSVAVPIAVATAGLGIWTILAIATQEDVAV